MSAEQLDAAAIEVERNEARAYARLIEGTPAAVADALELGVLDFAGASLFRAGRQQQALLFNRVIGLGVLSPFDASALASLDEAYRAVGVPAYAVEAIAGGNNSSRARLLAAGLVPFKRMTMLARRTGTPIAAARSDLRAEPATDADRSAWLALQQEVFGLDRHLTPVLAAAFDHAGQRPWVARAATGEIAGAALTTRIDSASAWIGWVCTHPMWRRQGAQAVLASAQMEACANEGIERVTLEASGTPARPGTSLRNYLRMGWMPVHERTSMLRRMP